MSKNTLPFLSILAAAFAVFVGLSSCSGKKVRAPDCFECTEQKQNWEGFSWGALQGSWKGSLEVVTNVVTAANKERKEDPFEINFVSGKDFLKDKQITTCGNFPDSAIVMDGELWKLKDEMTALNFASGKANFPGTANRVPASENGKKVFEVFSAGVDNSVYYGRVMLQRMNGETLCTYSRIGGNFYQNRLALPSLNFTERVTPDGRVLASGTTPEYEIQFEFLDFRPNGIAQKFSGAQARKPAAVEMHDRPQLFIRIFKMARNVGTEYARGEWTGTREYLYRMWRK